MIGRLRNEIGVMSYLAGHPNIVGLRVSKSEDYIFLLYLPRCSGVALSDPFLRNVNKFLFLIMNAQDVYESKSKGQIFIVQELCSGGALSDVIRKSAEPLSEERAASLFRGIIKSVLHCHQVRTYGGGVHALEAPIIGHWAVRIVVDCVHEIPAVSSLLSCARISDADALTLSPTSTDARRWASCTATSSPRTSSSRRAPTGSRWRSRYLGNYCP